MKTIVIDDKEIDFYQKDQTNGFCDHPTMSHARRNIIIREMSNENRTLNLFMEIDICPPRLS